MVYPRVTVAIPIYNAEKYLDFAIKSTLNQTYTDFELLLINDGSTDRLLSIMQKYDYDPRVKIVNDGQNKGLVYRLNQSIDLAKGEYYARMDADDIMHPERLQKQIDFLTQNVDVDILGSSIYCIDGLNQVCGYRQYPSSYNNEKKYLRECFFNHPSILGKRAWFVKNKYDERYLRMEDSELWSRTINNSNFRNLSVALLFYREVGIPSVNKYYLSTCSSVKFYMRNSFSRFTIYWSIFRSLIALCKLALFVLFTILGIQNFITRSRSSQISRNDVRRAGFILKNAIK